MTVVQLNMNVAQRVPVAVAGLLLTVGALAAQFAQGTRAAVLVALGAVLGFTLHRTGFGFASAYRRMIIARDPSILRPQVVMLGVATILFAPMLAAGAVFGQAVGGFVVPAGVALLFGAFLFGIGMQLAGGCGSGTLYTAGGGSPRMIVVLIFFIAGSFIGSLHLPWWEATPALPAISLGESLGWPIAIGVQVTVLAAIYAWSRSASIALAPRLMMIGGISLAILNAGVLATAGHPWGITWAFALWGAKMARAVGWSPDGSDFWNDGWQRAALDASVFADTTSLLDFGLILGAFAAAGLAGKFAPVWRIPARSLAAAIIGGLMMGYGARLASGCNIGAFFSGVASTSLHGWVWIIAALGGSWVGIILRPRFGLSN